MSDANIIFVKLTAHFKAAEARSSVAVGDVIASDVGAKLAAAIVGKAA